MNRSKRRSNDLEARGVPAAVLIGGLVAWLFIGSTVLSLLAL
jgi:hypothetical protein